MTYCLHHYVIDWDQVQTLDDVKRILKAAQISFNGNTDVSSIKDLVRLQQKPTIKAIPL